MWSTSQSTHSLYTMMAGAVANCVMNYLGIVWFGPVGVTYASFLAMVLVFVLRVIDSRSMIRLRLHLPHMGGERGPAGGRARASPWPKCPGTACGPAFCAPW